MADDYLGDDFWSDLAPEVAARQAVAAEQRGAYMPSELEQAVDYAGRAVQDWQPTDAGTLEGWDADGNLLSLTIDANGQVAGVALWTPEELQAAYAEQEADNLNYEYESMVQQEMARLDAADEAKTRREQAAAYQKAADFIMARDNMNDSDKFKFAMHGNIEGVDMDLVKELDEEAELELLRQQGFESREALQQHNFAKGAQALQDMARRGAGGEYYDVDGQVEWVADTDPRVTTKANPLERKDSTAQDALRDALSDALKDGWNG